MIRALYPQSSEALTAEDVERRYGEGPTRRVRANFIATLDAAVELNGSSGALGAPADKVVFFALRALSDVIVVGSGTARAEEYGPVRLDAGQRERRSRRGQRPTPTLAVISDSASLDPHARLFSAPPDDDTAARPVVFTTESAPPPRRAALGAVADVVVAGEQRVDVAEVVADLVARGLPDVLCEGGPTIFNRLASAGLVDELCLSFAPFLAGSGPLSLAAGDPHEPTALGLHELYEGDGLLLARYRRPLP